MKKLYRSKKDRMIAGVCGGIGEYLSIDSTFIRIAFALLSFGAGSGLLLYIVLAIIIPEEGSVETVKATPVKKEEKKKE